MKSQSKMSLYDIVLTGMMAAVVFAVTMFLSVKIPTPTGQTMLKLANAFILLAGVLFGGWRGGLAAGIGSMLFDLTDPMYVSEAWLTLIRFFLMGFICGKIAWAGGAQGRRTGQNLLAFIVASSFSTAFYIIKGIAVLMLSGSALVPALIGQAPKLGSSLFNLIVGVVLAFVLAPMLRKALAAAHVYDRLAMPTLTK